jgi:RNA polymerase sigma-70 factor (ECF subfamily)
VTESPWPGSDLSDDSRKPSGLPGGRRVVPGRGQRALAGNAGAARHSGMTRPAASEDPGAEWMAEFRGGDESAFDRIVIFYQEGVFHFLMRAVKDAGRAEDLVQEVFMRVYRSRSTYRRLAGFRSWLFTIAHRLALNELRAVRRRRRIFPVLFSGSAGQEDEAGEDFWANVEDRQKETPLEWMELRELQQILEKLLLDLPANQRLAVQLHSAEHFTYREIGEALGLSVMAVKSVLVRARENLKRRLEACAGSEASQGSRSQGEKQ